MFIYLVIRHIHNNTSAIWISDIEYQDVVELCNKENLDKEDYLTIFNQTGVSPYVIRNKINSDDLENIKELNNLYLKKPIIERIYVCYPFTTMEYNVKQYTPLVDIKDGDILVTFSTSTLDWRHGHCALVIDAAKNETIEHTMVGGKSQKGTITSWMTQPTFVVLRYDDENTVFNVVNYAKENLLGVDYSIFVGLDGNKDKSLQDSAFASHCSHIVWQAFITEGVDLDYNGGLIVTPKDIALSDKLKVVQIYGLNTEEYIDRLLW